MVPAHSDLPRHCHKMYAEKMSVCFVASCCILHFVLSLLCQAQHSQSAFVWFNVVLCCLRIVKIRQPNSQKFRPHAFFFAAVSVVVVFFFVRCFSLASALS